VSGSQNHIGRSRLGLDNLDTLLTEVGHSPTLDGCDINLIAVREPQPIELRSALANALAAPLAAPRLAELARGAASAVIITSDATRAVPNRVLLPAVVAELAAAGLDERQITAVIGVGAHRPMRPEELRAHLGEWATRLCVVNHDATAGDLSRAGTTTSGNEVYVNRLVLEADVRVALGQVEPHEFAGFSGGPKAILPAVAGYDSILRNHSLGMLRDPQSRPGILDGNPIRGEMVEAARLAHLDFAVNVVVDRALRPLAVAAGDAVAVQDELAGFIRSYAQVEPPADVDGSPLTPDLVVTGPGQPLAVNLYQTVKALVGIEALVGRQTVVLLVSSCDDDTGGRDWLTPFEGALGPEEVLARLEDDYTVERDHSYFLARFLRRCPQVVVCCPGVTDDDLRRLFLEPAKDAMEGLGRGGGGGGGGGGPPPPPPPAPASFSFRVLNEACCRCRVPHCRPENREMRSPPARSSDRVTVNGVLSTAYCRQCIHRVIRGTYDRVIRGTYDGE
jgi:nickel-dependent lactate racemase